MPRQINRYIYSVPMEPEDWQRVWEGDAGTLAYYLPWSDVVMFYNDYNVNPSLFELGQSVSGTELIVEMTGTIVIDFADTGDE